MAPNSLATQGSTVNDIKGSGWTSDASSAAAVPGRGGLIDVSGLTFDELRDAIGVKDAGRALDYILAAGQNGSGYHGFNNHI